MYAFRIIKAAPALNACTSRMVLVVLITSPATYLAAHRPVATAMMMLEVRVAELVVVRGVSCLRMVVEAVVRSYQQVRRCRTLWWFTGSYEVRRGGGCTIIKIDGGRDGALGR